MTERRDAIEILIADHGAVARMFLQLEPMLYGEGDPKQAKRLVDEAVVELVRHSVAEERHLYPTVAEVVEGGQALAAREREEHAVAERTMKELQALDPTAGNFGAVAARLMAEVRQHVEEEENELFPKLRAALDEPALAELGAKIQRAKATAPTRPHPAAPTTPPWNSLLAPVTGLVDRVRDAVSGRGR